MVCPVAVPWKTGDCRVCQRAKSCKHLQAVIANPALKVLDAGSRCMGRQKRRDQERQSCMETEKMGVVEH